MLSCGQMDLQDLAASILLIDLLVGALGIQAMIYHQLLIELNAMCLHKEQARILPMQGTQIPLVKQSSNSLLLMTGWREEDTGLTFIRRPGHMQE